ncbi:MAG: hypothetical protein JSW67_04835 [Candidatus Latescibacterota bacterium]|nr:MAG: hypothetical protein JSW67_04835 [Candidatus Latescibacterota bacterium]
MSRHALAAGCAGLLLGILGCGGTSGTLQHPLTNQLDPGYDALTIKTLAALPFASDVAEDEDPDQIAAGMLESKFYPELNRSSGFTILPASEVGRVIEEEGMSDRMRSFYRNWISDQQDTDEQFLRDVADRLEVHAIVVGAVDVWYQEPVDITQEGKARTQVGVLIGLFEGSSGKRLWLGRDENYKDAVRYPGPGQLSSSQIERTRERTNVRTAGGVYAPPDYSEVVDLVVDALIEAFPPASP